MRDYEEVLRRCEEQGIDTSDCDIYIEPGYLNGHYCLNHTISHDGNWMCIPEKQFSDFLNEEVYVPICHEVKGSFTTYLGNGEMCHLRNIYLLYKRR